MIVRDCWGETTLCVEATLDWDESTDHHALLKALVRHCRRRYPSCHVAAILYSNDDRGQRYVAYLTDTGAV